MRTFALSLELDPNAEALPLSPRRAARDLPPTSPTASTDAGLAPAE